MDEASFDAVPTDGAASFASSRAMLRAMMCAAGPEQMMADAEFAAAQETPSSTWRDTALCVLGEAHLLAGDLDRAVATLEEATSVGLALGHTDTVVLSDSELALIAMEAGRWDEAADRVETALGIVEEHRMHDYAISILTFAAAARLAVHQADLAEADRRLTEGMRVRPASTFVLPFLATRGRLQLAKVCMMRGDQASARLLLREIDDVLRRRPRLGALADQVSEFRAMASTTSVGKRWRVTPDLGRAAAPSLPADAPHHRRDSRATADLAQHGRHAGDRHLSQAQRVLPWRGRRAGHHARAARRMRRHCSDRSAPGMSSVS